MFQGLPHLTLGELNASVAPVLSAIRQNQGCSLPEEACHADIVAIMAQNIALINGKMIEHFAERFETHPPTAVVYTVSCSGSFPSRAAPGHPNLREFMMTNAGRGIPQFAVKDAPYPQLANRELVLPEYGVTLLENACSGNYNELIYAIHRAFDITKDPRVLEATLYWFYRQTQYPPQGWSFRQTDALVPTK